MASYKCFFFTIYVKCFKNLKNDKIKYNATNLTAVLGIGKGMEYVMYLYFHIWLNLIKKIKHKYSCTGDNNSKVVVTKHISETNNQAYVHQV